MVKLRVAISYGPWSWNDELDDHAVDMEVSGLRKRIEITRVVKLWKGYTPKQLVDIYL